jgi:hypothetical protein
MGEELLVELVFNRRAGRCHAGEHGDVENRRLAISSGLSLLRARERR